MKIDNEDMHLFEGMSLYVANGYIRAWDGEKARNVSRIILGLADDDPREGEHINNDPLYNTRNNLRIATHSINMQNRDGWGEYPKGISTTLSGLYQARIQKDGKRINLGSFERIEDAVEAYNKAALEIYGEHAWLSNG
jgi:hypothetical protein